MKRHHQYRVTVEEISGEEGNARSLTFAARCHDDLFNVIEKTRQHGGLEADESVAMAVGLKLLGEVVLTHREDPLFADLFGHIGTFIRKLKSEIKADGAAM